VDAVRKTLVIASQFREARKAEAAVLACARRLGYADSAQFALKLALEEGLNNAIKHGNGFALDKKVQLTFEGDRRQIRITITDQGPGFDPDTVPDPTDDENIEKPSGRGIMLMRAYMDEVQYSKSGNQVQMLKRNDASGE
jgi:serine/threonine-protein kinase RsbW